MHNKGTIVTYSADTNAGIIQTEDGTKLYFSMKSWLSPDIAPKAGLTVEFLQGPQAATKVRVIPS